MMTTLIMILIIPLRNMGETMMWPLRKTFFPFFLWTDCFFNMRTVVHTASFSYLASRCSKLVLTVSFWCLMEFNKLCIRCLWDPTASSCCTKLTQRWTWKNMDIETVIRYCWGVISKYVSKKLMHTFALTSPNIIKQINGKQLPKTQKKPI